MLELNQYQKYARTTAYYPTGPNKALCYTSIALAGEVGEYCNEVKKHLRDKLDAIDPVRRDRMIDELGDSLWYFCACADVLNVTLEEIARRNLEKLAGRYAAGK